MGNQDFKVLLMVRVRVERKLKWDLNIDGGLDEICVGFGLRVYLRRYFVGRIYI